MSFPFFGRDFEFAARRHGGRMRYFAQCCLLLFAAAACLPVPCSAQTRSAGSRIGLELALAAEDVDWEHTVEVPANPDVKRFARSREDQILRVLGLKHPPSPLGGWRPGKGPGTRYLRLALKKPIRLGTIIDPDRVDFALLRRGAPFPGDLRDHTHWRRLNPVGPQPGAAVYVLEPNTTARAIRFGVSGEKPKGGLTRLRLLAGRLYNRTPEATAVASSVAGKDDTQRRRQSAANLVAGGQWVGGDGTPVSADNPQWVMLSWPRPVELRCLALIDPFMKNVHIEKYAGDWQTTPVTAPDSDWRPVATVDVVPNFRAPNDRLIDFGSVVKTTALRLRITESFSDEDQDIAKLTGGRADRVALEGLLALTYLGEKAPPVSTQLPLPIPYTLDEPGKVVMVINDAAGRRVRNLVAEAERSAGQNAETWDGRDDQGRLVPPGQYTYQAAWTPPIGLHYEFTVNNAGDPPWWKQDVWEPGQDPGGWISDHCPACSAAAIGKMVFLGAETAEHGHSIIATDLAGKKLWGAKWLELAGARCLASDGKLVYAAGEGSWIGNMMKVFAVDPNTWSVRKVTETRFGAPPAGRSGGLSGLAARDGLIYAAFNSPHHDHTTSRLEAGALDPAASTGNLQPLALGGLIRAVEPSQPWVNLPLPDGPKTVLRIAWKTPQRVGTILSPHKLQVAALKPHRQYPGDLEDDTQWIALEGDLVHPAMKLYTMPGGVRTRALRIRVLNRVNPVKTSEPQDQLQDSDQPPTKFVGLRAMAPWLRRVKTLSQFQASAGKLYPGGSWNNRQKTDITPANPATYTVLFKPGSAVRAMVLRDPFFAKAEVLVQKTPGGPFEKHGKLAPSFYWRRAYTDVTYDFLDQIPVSAVRLVITEPAVEQNFDVKQRTGRTRRVCSLGGVVFLTAGQIDPPIEPDLAQRITVLRAADGKVLREFPIKQPRALAFTPKGQLLAVSGDRVVRVDLEKGAVAETLLSGLDRPRGLTCDADGNIFVAEHGSGQVKRFSASGKLTATIGKPGGIDNGPYDPQHMSHPTGIAVDAEGKLWVSENEYQPKKVSVWSLTGERPKLVKFFLGGPPYGGGFMFIDPRQPGRMFFYGMEFEIDWPSGTHRLKNVVWRGGRGQAWRGVTCDRPIYRGDDLYLAGQPHNFYHNRYMAVARYRNDRAVPVAAAGLAERWPPLADPAIRQKLGNPELDEFSFVWSDLDGNGSVEADEIQLGPQGFRLQEAGWGCPVGFDLSLQFTNMCLAPVKFTDEGVPVYSFDHTRPTPPPLGTSKWYGNSYHCMALTRDDHIIEISPKIAVKPRTGPPAWTYPDDFIGVHGSQSARPPQPGMLVGSLQVIGQGTLKGAGEVFAIGTNKGEAYVFTLDGLLVARLFRDHRYGKGFNLPEAKRGMSVAHVSLNTEHFGGTFNQLDDGRVFLVAGHNHNSVIRVDGLQRIRRFRGRIELTAAQFLAAERLAHQAAAERAEPKRLAIERAPAAVKLDGELADWENARFVKLQGTGSHRGRAALAWNKDHLLLAFDVKGTRGLVNRNNDWKMLFKSGDSVDLQLGTRPGASRRAAAGVGDLRLLISQFDGRPIAVLYRYVVPGAPNDQKTHFGSPVGSVTIDSVLRLDARIKIAPGSDGYTVEAAIPWSELGAEPRPGLELGGDLGILFADEAGTAVSERVYWSNPATGLVADVPGEVRIVPRLWGTFHLE